MEVWVEFGLVSQMQRLRDWFPDYRILPEEWQPPSAVTGAIFISDQSGEFDPSLFHSKGLFHPKDLEGPRLASLAETVGLESASDALLEDAWSALLSRSDGWDSPEDVQRLMRISAERWQRAMRAYSRSWLAAAEMAYTFSEEEVTLEDGTWGKLWQSAGDYKSWGEFASDFLELPPPAASQMRGVWEIYRVRLGWSKERMAAVGKAKLGLALKAMRDAVHTEDKARVEDLTLLLEQSTFSEVADKLAADRGDGAVIYFFREPFEDWALLETWFGVAAFFASLGNGRRYSAAELRERWQGRNYPSPHLLHSKISINGESFDSGLAILIDPAIPPEDVAQIKKKLGRALRWERPESNSQGEVKDGSEAD